MHHASGQTQTAGQIVGETPAGTIDGANSVFALRNVPSPGTVAVYKNGLRQAASQDFSAAGTQISFSARSTPQPGDALLADYALQSTVTAPPPTAQHSRAIAVNHAKVPNSDQTNFPVYLLLNDPALKTVANGGHVQSALAIDLAFYADTGLTQLLPFEIVSYNGVSGSLAAVVKFPVLSHTADSIFYLSYGAPGVSASLANPTAVWAGYAGVYHLEDAANNTIANSAAGEGQAGNGSSVNPASAMTTAGSLGSGLAFNGASDRLDLGSYTVVNGTRTLTYSGWVKFNALSEYACIFEKFDSTQTYGSAVLLSGHWTTSDHDWYTAVRASGSTGDTTMSFGLQTNAWYQFAYVYSAGVATFYVNGAPVPLGHYGPANPPAIPAAALDLLAGIGLSGVLDELRVSTRTYTPDWIATEYNNQSNPASFAALGAELQ
jgi:hypothetical protein